MRILKNLLFIIALLAIPAGILFKMHLLSGGGLITLGLLGMFLYYTAKTIKDCVKKRNNTFIIIMQIGVVLTSIVLHSKYQLFFYGDYPGLVIIPWFISMICIYFVRENDKNIKLSSVSIVYLILFIPLFCFDFWGSPRRFIPHEWVDRYDVKDGIEIVLPYEFKYAETEQLCQKAYQLKNKGDYDNALIVFQEAYKIEPYNPLLLFELSEVYARTNHLEAAIELLDAAIVLDSTNSAFYNNRGLLHYKLKENDLAIADYTKAIKIDSTKTSLYINLALVYYHEKRFDVACQSIDYAEKLGYNVKTNKHISMIKRRYCNTK